MKINLSDFEKLVLGISTSLSVLTILGVYIYKGTVDTNLIYLVTVLVSAFVARKGLKYHYECNGLVTDSTSDGDSTNSTDSTTKVSAENK